ncbi:hypothetical protein FHX59_001850 [Paraburkholderia silvatlantica]|uniref:Uncharacterized protein n=1 Tax=Paraburkholderia silvatlantica TaxID=321895 RepID=A0ABR6FJ20_9BURK|nr:hypothetical protein [Paraburkholderia silvatlantica]PVY36145.1 hypothetical protein C7411_10316 [Paraburkholderia silvatlantica]PXW40439.1 hypothetical protein C7413_104302 [Paraburkholderia silvatlantica]
MKKGKAVRLPFFCVCAGLAVALKLPTDFVDKLVENAWNECPNPLIDWIFSAA